MPFWPPKLFAELVFMYIDPLFIPGILVGTLLLRDFRGKLFPVLFPPGAIFP